MAYNYNIPQATDALSTSQGQILANFTLLGSIAGNANTSTSSINTTAGFNWLYLATQTNIPPTGSSFTSGNVALYSAQNPTTSKNELYINKLNQATVTQIPATASTLSINSNPGNLSNGFSYLPSGILLQWGFSNLTGGPNPQTVTFPLSFPTTPILVIATPYNTSANGFIVTGTYTQTTFNALFSISAGGLQWIAIGY